MTEISQEPMSPAEAEAWDNLKTHRGAWRQAIISARDFACEGSEEPEADRSYWNHELRAFDRTFSAILASPRFPPLSLAETGK